MIADWLAARYNRPAFPNTFEDLIENKKKEKKVKNLDHISGLYISLFPDRELNDGEKYSVELIAAFRADQDLDHTSAEMREPLKELVELMREAGMEVSYRLMPESEISLSLLREGFKPWKFDYISYRNDDDLPVKT